MPTKTAAITTLCLLLAAPLALASAPRPDSAPGQQATPASGPDGKAVFERYCRCHEPEGPKSLKGQSPERIAQALQNRKMRHLSGGKRVKVAQLSHDEIEAVSRYVAAPEGWSGNATTNLRSAP